MPTSIRLAVSLLLISFYLPVAFAAEPDLVQRPNLWVKRGPLEHTPVSPRLSYETSYGYDPVAKRLIRFAGHNQGGGGEQNAEVWTLDPLSLKWDLQEPNTSPPGACCNQQNVFDPVGGRFLRFRAFSGSHGWHWFRENYLSNTSVWSYDLAENKWRNLRTLPDPHVRPLRCASWDAHHQVVVMFGGEGGREGTIVYDPDANEWTWMKPGREPPPRSAGNMAYDSKHRLHILFGAQFSDDPHTWAYDLSSNTWKDMQPPSQPPTNRNDPVLAFDEANGVTVALVRAVDKQNERGHPVEGHLETWTYDAGKNQWQQRNPPVEPDGFASRRRVMVYLPDQDVCLLENYCRPQDSKSGEREQQIWTYRVGVPDADPRPHPPQAVQLIAERDAVTLEWKSAGKNRAREYAVFRGSGRHLWKVSYREIARVGGDQHSYRDAQVQADEPYCYFVQAIDREGRKSEPSRKVRVQPRHVEDVVVSVRAADQVELRWPASDGAAGYVVERAVVEVFSEAQVKRLKTDTPPLAKPSVGTLKRIGSFQRLTAEPIQAASFVDEKIDLTQPAEIAGEPIWQHRFRDDQLDPRAPGYRYGVYAYRVRAVSPLGVESGPSPYALTIPSSPQWLFSREDETRCHLKWEPNPEKGIAGYRVYRMDSPRINGAGQKVHRLTETPFAETRFTDDQAGESTKRYWVMAVDALGQEGIPSAPVWHYREWRKFYLPFIGEWHQ